MDGGPISCKLFGRWTSVASIGGSADLGLVTGGFTKASLKTGLKTDLTRLLLVRIEGLEGEGWRLEMGWDDIVAMDEVVLEVWMSRGTDDPYSQGIH